MADNPYVSIMSGGSSPSTTNPYVSIMGGGGSDGPYSSPATASTQEQNPYAAIMGGTTPPAPAASAPDEGFSDKVRDIWNSDEGTLSKVWDTANTPMVNLRRDGATGVEAGVEDFATGMATPLSAGLTVATMGAGGLLGNMGIDLAKMAGPEVVKAAQTAGKLAAVGFTAQQIKGIADEVPSFTQAVQNGDTNKALEIGTNALLSAGMAGLGAKHAASELGLVGSEGDSASTPSKQLVGAYQKDIVDDAHQSTKFVNSFKNDVKDPTARNAIQFYTEAGGAADDADPDAVQTKLNTWRDQISNSDNVSDGVKKQVLGALDKAQDLSDSEKDKAQELRGFYDKDFQEASNNGVLGEKGVDNFVARARWNDEPSDEEQNVNDVRDIVGTPYQDHTQRRIFGSTVDGLLQGNEPIQKRGQYVFDAADIAGDYHMSIGRAIAQKNFVNNALKTIGQDGRPLAVKGGILSRYSDADGQMGLTLNGHRIGAQPLTRAEATALFRSGRMQDMIQEGTLHNMGERETNEDETESAPTAQSAAQTTPQEEQQPAEEAAPQPIEQQEGQTQEQENVAPAEEATSNAAEPEPAQEAAAPPPEEEGTPQPNAAESPEQPAPTDNTQDDTVETEYHPGDELPAPVSQPAEPPLEDQLKKLPETMQIALYRLRDEIANHADLVSSGADEDHIAGSQSSLEDLRNQIEDSLGEIKRLPKGVRQATLDFLKQSVPTELDKFNDGYYRGKYRYDTTGYDNKIQHRYSWGSTFGGRDGVSLRSPLAWSPEVSKQAKLILNPEKSWLQKNPVAKKVMDISTAAKHSLLSFSAFHWTQIGLRGVESGINPLKPLLEMKDNVGGLDLSNPRHVKMIEAGGFQPAMPSAAQSFAEGLSGKSIFDTVPGIGPQIADTMHAVNNALFGMNGYIDRMKLNAALSFEERLRQTNPNLDEMSRYKVAGELANQRFGGLNYTAMGRSTAVRDIMRLTLLAPDWMESNLRDAASTLGPFGKISRQDVARIALANFAVAQTMNYLTTGKMHLDQPFGVVSKDGKKVYTVRTMPADIMHALMDPRDYAANRLNPVLSRTAVEAITGRDKQGHIRDLGQQITDLVQNVTPIPLQGVANAVTGNVHFGQDPSDYVRSAAGLTTRVNNSAAQDMAYRLASQDSSTGALPSEQAAHIQHMVGYEDRLRQGDQLVAGDMQRAVVNGEMAPADVRQALKASQSPRLTAVVNRLPISDAINVWNISTNAERQELAPTLIKKMASFRKTEQMKMTPAQQAEMNVKLAKVYNDMSSPRQ